MEDLESVIKFRCENCGQKFSVHKNNAGKKGKCPKCKKILVIPKQAEPTTPNKSTHAVNFTCSMCEQAIQVPESSSGKLIECPHCGCFVEVPSDKTTTENSKAQTQIQKEDTASDLTLEERQKLGGEIRADESEQVEERKLPWPVDIFLYPTSASGMIHIALFVILPILFDLLNRFVFSFAGHYGGMLLMIFYIFLYGYMFYYFAECIRDSSTGGLRAPDTPANIPSKGDMIEQFVSLLACYALFLGPVIFYRGYTHFTETQMNSVIFWCLYAYGIFFLPMGLLAVVMFNSVNGLNPILLICSIASTFFQYCGLIIIICLLGFLLIAIGWILPQSRIIGYALSAVSIYLAMVLAHILGRFYRRYQERLNWEV